MMHREEFLRKHPNIKGSMIAYSEDGEKLGKVTTLFEESLNIEKGIFFPKDYTIRYDDVVEVHDNDMIVHLRSSDLRGMKGGAATEGESGFAGGTKGSRGPGREELVKRRPAATSQYRRPQAACPAMPHGAGGRPEGRP